MKIKIKHTNGQPKEIAPRQHSLSLYLLGQVSAFQWFVLYSSTPIAGAPHIFLLFLPSPHSGFIYLFKRPAQRKSTWIPLLSSSTSVCSSGTLVYPAIRLWIVPACLTPSSICLCTACVSKTSFRSCKTALPSLVVQQERKLPSILFSFFFSLSGRKALLPIPLIIAGLVFLANRTVPDLR